MNRWALVILTCSTAAAGAGCGAVVGEPIARGGAAPSTLGDGLVGYWKLDETGPDEPVLDSSGLVNHGTPLNHPAPATVLAPVRIPNSASRAFNGVDQLIDLGNPAPLNFAGEITLAAWVYVESVVDQCHTVISHGYRRNPHAEVSLRGGGGPCVGEPLVWAIGVWDGADHFAQMPLLPSDIGAWIHLAGTYDGQAWHLYSNGIERATRVDTLGAFPIDAPWGIGGRAAVEPPGDRRLFTGRLDEVRIYNRALSPSEILDLYHL
jgi:hypothetical protein